jgi:hypothetical protein
VPPHPHELVLTRMIRCVRRSAFKLARHISEDELSMDVLVAEAVLEFGNDLREAREAVCAWTTPSTKR